MPSRWSFSDGYPATRTTHHRRQKHSRSNWCLNCLLESWSVWWTFLQILHCGYRILGEMSWESKCGATPPYIFEACSTWKIAQARNICFWTGNRWSPVTQWNWIVWNGNYGWNRYIGPALNNPSMFYVGGVQINAYFYSCGNYRKYGQIDCAETFRESGPWRYELRSSTGVAFKIWVGQKNTSKQCWKCCWLDIQ